MRLSGTNPVIASDCAPLTRRVQPVAGRAATGA